MTHRIMVQLISGVGGVSLQKAENSRVKKKGTLCHETGLIAPHRPRNTMDQPAEHSTGSLFGEPTIHDVIVPGEQSLVLHWNQCRYYASGGCGSVSQSVYVLSTLYDAWRLHELGDKLMLLHSFQIVDCFSKSIHNYQSNSNNFFIWFWIGKKRESLAKHRSNSIVKNKVAISVAILCVSSCCWIIPQNYEVIYFYKGLNLHIQKTKIKRRLELLLVCIQTQCVYTSRCIIKIMSITMPKQFTIWN